MNQKFRFRETVFKKSLRQDMAWFTEHHIGEVMANIFRFTIVLLDLMRIL